MLRFGACVALLLSAAAARPTDDNGQDKSVAKRATTYWYANMDHTGDYRGIAPDIDDGDYKVFIEVSAGDGGSIQGAINSATNGERNGQWLASQPRVSQIHTCNCIKKLTRQLGGLHSSWHIRDQQHHRDEH